MYSGKIAVPPGGGGIEKCFLKKEPLLWKTILNAIFITRSVLLFFVCVRQKVLLLRLGLFSIVYLIFQKNNLFQNGSKKIYQASLKNKVDYHLTLNYFLKKISLPGVHFQSRT
jgi:hypothetical protein